MTSEQEKIFVFILIGLLVAFLLLSMNKSSCSSTQSATSTTNAPFTNKENFEPVQEGANLAQNTVQAVEFTVKDPIKVDVPTNEIYEERQNLDMAIKAGEIDDSGVLNVQGSDLLLAAAAERFYSIDVKGQSNKNSSYDIRGEEPIPYNENYTPFSASHIVGEPKITTGRL